MKRTKQAASPSEAEDTSRRPNRRQALALGGAAAAAAAVAALGVNGGKKAHAVNGVPLYLGQVNDAGTVDTGLVADAPEALWVGNTGTGYGIRGYSAAGTGVWGHSPDGIGVDGTSPGNRPAVEAFSGWKPHGPPEPDGGLALDVIGKARFSTAGAGVVPAGARSVEVANPAVTDASHVTVTFTGHPGNAAAVVQWVERQPGTGFIVHLRGAVSNETPFTYLIVEPGS